MIILETGTLKSSGIYPNETDYEEVGLFENRAYVSRENYDTGWAIIDGKRTNLHDGRCQLRVRFLKPTIQFLAPRNGPLVQNIELIDELYKEFESSKKVNAEWLDKLKRITRSREASMYD